MPGHYLDTEFPSRLSGYERRQIADKAQEDAQAAETARAACAEALAKLRGLTFHANITIAPGHDLEDIIGALEAGAAIDPTEVARASADELTCDAMEVA